ncbi:MAG: septal ring lytic transglycosylase RlpA family protein [Candidatus Omnitrophica bacterium]|nr:septal ring lytic transglycosylase RlpA family protein [Candidatus Omnitrophota bacterium]
MHFAVLGVLFLSMTGCGGFKVVRIPIPIPTFGIGEQKTAKKDVESVDQQIQKSGKRVEIGQASWYGRKFHGKRTASGEKYSMYAMTAAHPTLPFDTKVKITNLDNGKTAYVRINDRGPFVKGRIIDVSRAAARKLGFELKGIAQVKIETL